MTKGHTLGRKTSRDAYSLLLAFVLLAAAAGCDTVAEISIEKDRFQDIAAIGAINDVDCASTDTEISLRFALLDGDDEFLRPGRRTTARISIDGSDASFQAEDITFAGQSFLYPAPDIDCTADGDCPFPFACVPVNPSQSDSRTACGTAIAVQTFQGSVMYTEGADDQRGVVLEDNSESLAGVDANGGFQRLCATDELDRRLAAAQSFLLRYRNTSAFSEDTRICVARYSGLGRSGTFFFPSRANCLTGDYQAAVGSLGSLTVGELGESPIWSAILESVEAQLANASGDRWIVLFTDGLDDGSGLDDFQTALQAVIDAGVQVHVVQLDTDPGEPLAQDGSAIECGFTPVGPDDELARLACESNGSFQYASTAESLRTFYSGLAHTIPEYYTVGLEVPQLASGDIAPGQYRLATTMTVNLVGETRSIAFVGDQTDPGSQDIIDSRLTLFKRPVPPRPVEEEETEDEGT